MSVPVLGLEMSQVISDIQDIDPTEKHFFFSLFMHSFEGKGGDKKLITSKNTKL